MQICSYYSRKVIDVDGDVVLLNMEKLAYPWELETFLLLSIKATPEYREGNFEGKNINKFISMVNGIREFEHPELKRREGDIAFADYFMVACGLIQFDIQEATHYKLYRYSYIFNFHNDEIDMNKIFKDYFGVSYQAFLEFGSFLMLLFGSNMNFDNKLLDYLAKNMFFIPFQKLSITLNEYKEQLDEITTNTDDYITCLRPSYKYPFIVKGSLVYLPLPHIIGRAITSALLYRLTENNGALRTKIGKEILESYLIKILEESKAYDEIYPEHEFVKEHHNKAKTLDVMLRVGDEFLMLDSKATVPSIGLRVYDQTAHEKEIEKLSEKVVQIYRHLREFLPKFPSYNPYKGSPNIDINHLWGMSVMLEDSYIRRELIYEAAAEKLYMKRDSEDYSWMTNHIKVTNLYDIERYAFTGKSLMEGLKYQIEHGNPGDYALSDYGQIQEKQKSKDYEDFIEKLKSSFIQIAKELVTVGVIPKS